MSKRPTILHVRVVTGSGGGPEKTILNSPRFLRHLGYRCLCAYLHPPEDPGFGLLAQRARAWHAPVVEVPDRGPWDLSVVYELARICRRYRVAVWHAHEYKSSLLGLLLRRTWPMKLVTTVHGWVLHTKKTPLYYGIERAALRCYDEVLCVSDDLHSRCLGMGIRPHRCHLIHNAIDTAQFSRTLPRDEARSRVGLSNSALVLGAMGRLSVEKGFDLLIQAVARLVAQGHDIHLLIAGEGPERPRLEAEIMKHQLGQRVKLLGLLADPRSFLQAIDVFVLSSVREGLPNVLLEAMAMEAPVVATKIAGIPALLRDGKLGVLVEPGSAGAIATGIESLAGDIEKRHCLAMSARQCIEEHYSFERRMQRVAVLYDRLLHRSAASPEGCQRKSA